MIASWCCIGLQRGMSGNSVALMGLFGHFVGTLGDGATGLYWFSTLGVGSVTLGVVSLLVQFFRILSLTLYCLHPF
jgi:hypothetical protein